MAAPHRPSPANDSSAKLPWPPASGSAHPAATRSRAHDLGIDVARLACTLYIVGFWHLFNYSTPPSFIYNAGFAHLTVAVLALFCLISGYLLTPALGSTQPFSAGQFFKRRLLKLYPPYLLAHAVFVVLGLTDWPTALRSAMFAGMFLRPAPYTLWFMSMIFTFYLLLPLLRSNCASAGRFVALTTALWLAFLMYGLLSNRLDHRLLIYWPSFALGVFAGANPQTMGFTRGRLLALFATSAVLMALHMALGIDPERDTPSLAFATTSSALLVLAFRRWGNMQLAPLFALLGQASFFIYLFHRPLYSGLRKIYFPTHHYAQWVILIVLFLPAMLAIATAMHQGYGRGLAWLTQMPKKR